MPSGTWEVRFSNQLISNTPFSFLKRTILVAEKHTYRTSWLGKFYPRKVFLGNCSKKKSPMALEQKIGERPVRVFSNFFRHFFAITRSPVWSSQCLAPKSPWRNIGGTILLHRNAPSECAFCLRALMDVSKRSLFRSNDYKKKKKRNKSFVSNSHKFAILCYGEDALE